MLLKAGRVIAQGPTADVLTPHNLRELYEVDADVQRHASGHMVVVPLRRIAR